MPVLTHTSVKPQHIRTFLTDPHSQDPTRLTIYTGQLSVGHGAGSDRKPLTIEYPVLGLFPPVGTSGAGVPGILPFDNRDPPQFQGAVAMAGLSDMVDKTDPAVWQIRDITADLREVRLSPHTDIRAVVLRFVAEAQNSEVDAVQYQVTVLSKDLRRLNMPELPPILLGSPIWDGNYGFIGGTVISGVPNS